MGADRLAKVGKKRAAWPTPRPRARKRARERDRGRAVSRRAVIHQGGMALDFRATRFASPRIDSPVRRKKEERKKKKERKREIIRFDKSDFGAPARNVNAQLFGIM